MKFSSFSPPEVEGARLLISYIPFQSSLPKVSELLLKRGMEKEEFSELLEKVCASLNLSLELLDLEFVRLIKASSIVAAFLLGTDEFSEIDFEIFPELDLSSAKLFVLNSFSFTRVPVLANAALQISEI